MSAFDVAIIGSGFAGSILARCLRRLGLGVLLVEKARHPRFALGESSTPLAAIALERLARRWDLPDLRALAAWGRWRQSHPDLGRGLKRGFTFFAHRRGEPFRADAENTCRLLVAASPSDEVADVHWLRSDVDRYLARRAAEEGAELLQETELAALARGTKGFDLELRSAAGSRRVATRFVVDATGAAGAAARLLGVRRIAPLVTSSLVYSHFRGVPDFAEVVEAAGRALPPGPYPDDRAAVHHLLDSGWIYLLPFDHGVTSGGWISVGRRAAGSSKAAGTPEEEWRRTIAAHPSLEAQLGAAEPLFPLRRLDPMQWRLDRATGPGWALLPHTLAFSDPIFSTGIAWSVLGVERLADAFDRATRDGGLRVEALDEPLDRYARRLDGEVRRIGQLVRGAYLSLGDFEAFVELSFLYFAFVSFAETGQRLRGIFDRRAVWEGYLGAGDPAAGAAFEGVLTRLETLGELEDRDRGAAVAELRHFVAHAIRRWNVAGLADPARRNLYPVDLELLVERAELLGITPEAMRERLPGLLRV